MLLYDARDYELTEFHIGAFDKTNKTVEVRFKNFGRPVTLLYQMDKTTAGWRISDIRDEKGRSLLKMLRSLNLNQE